MKEKLKKIMDSFHKYNTEKMAYLAFGLSDEVEYDALVVAPSFTPYKLKLDSVCTVTTLREGAYISGYLVKKDGMKIAWIKTSSSASNLIDHIAVAAELKFKKIIFIGAVGALTSKYALGDICTSGFYISGGYANTYLKDSIKDFVPFERIYPDMMYIDKVVLDLKKKGYELRKASVFCTDSIACEYYHLDEIKEGHLLVTYVPLELPIDGQPIEILS